MKKNLILIFILIITNFAYSEKIPDWVKTYGNETGYDESKFLTGFGIADNNFENAKEFALREISSAIKTKIISQLELTQEEKNGELNSMCKINIQSTVDIELSGIKKYEKYYDKKEKKYFALCVLDKQDYLSQILLERKTLLENYKEKLTLINQLLEKNNYSIASNEYSESNKLLEKINENFLICNFLKKNQDLTDLYELFEQKKSIYNKLKTVEINSMNDLTNVLLSPFNSIDFSNKTFSFIPAYYKTTKISSEFFYYLKEYCSSKLELKGGKVLDNFTDNLPFYIFKGSFYDTISGYKILYSLTDTKANSKVNIVELFISKDFVTESGLKILPENIDIASKDNKIFSEGTLEESKIKIKAWTGKGSENLIFKKGELVEFYVQVNKSGYISILYHLAGKNRIRTPLIQNYYISEENINKQIKIYYTFEVYPPYGSETAQFFFSTTKQPPLETIKTTIDNEEYEVLANDFNEAMAKKRGLNENNKDNYSETFISINTIEK